MFFKNKKVAIYGGAFNPPTLGHEYVLKSLENKFDEIWIMPTHKSFIGKDLLPLIDRVAMCQIAFKDLLDKKNSKFKIKLDEYISNNDGSTHDLLNHLESNYIHDFYFVIGKDNANSIFKWKNGEQLIGLTKFVIVPRTDTSNSVKDLAWYNKKPHIVLNIKPTSGDISSTNARQHFQLLCPGKFLANLSNIKTILNKDLIDFVDKNGFYKMDYLKELIK